MIHTASWVATYYTFDWNYSIVGLHQLPRQSSQQSYSKPSARVQRMTHQTQLNDHSVTLPCELTKLRSYQIHRNLSLVITLNYALVRRRFLIANTPNNTFKYKRL